MKAAIVYDSGTHTTKKMKSWADVFVAYFQRGIKRNIVPRLGIEIEHFIVSHDTKTAVPYDGKNGVREILCRLMAHYPNATVLMEEDLLLGFLTEDFTVTLEPAGQIEISIVPTESIACIADIYADFCRILQKELSPHNYDLMTVGCQPVSCVDNLPLIPKMRYRLLDEHFAKTGDGGREMMRGTASLQVSVDYFSEDDFRRKIQAAYYYSPIFKILTDNSPTFEGKLLTGFLKRTDIWRRVDKVRVGIVPRIFKPDFNFGDYAVFIGSIPPIFLPTKAGYRFTGDKTTAELYADKMQDEKEIEHILSMAFPEVRLKTYLELRMADSVPMNLMLAYCALLKGLLYSEEGVVFAEDSIRQSKLMEDDILAAEDNLMAKGFEAEVYGQPVRRIAANMINIAEGNLPHEERNYLQIFNEMIFRR